MRRFLTLHETASLASYRQSSCWPSETASAASINTLRTGSGNLTIEVHLAFDLHIQPFQDFQQRIPRYVLIILAFISRDLPGVHMHQPSEGLDSHVSGDPVSNRRHTQVMQRKDAQFLFLGFFQLFVVLHILSNLRSKLCRLSPSRSNHGLWRLGMTSNG